MAHYGKRTKKSSYTQTLHLKPFAAGFSRKNWKGNLLTESRFCFENRLAELSLSNLGSRSQFPAGGTSGSCSVRDSGVTERQHSRGRWYSDMTCCQWPNSCFSQGPCPARPCPGMGGLSRCFGAHPQLSPCPRLCQEKCSGFAPAQAVKAIWPWQQRSPACSTLSPRPGKGRRHQEKWCHRQRSRETAVTWGHDCQLSIVNSISSTSCQVMKWRGHRDDKEIWMMSPPHPKDHKSNLEETSWEVKSASHY